MKAETHAMLEATAWGYCLMVTGVAGLIGFHEAGIRAAEFIPVALSSVMFGGVGAVCGVFTMLAGALKFREAFRHARSL